MTKRQRCDDTPSWWKEIVEEVHSKEGGGFGFVHSSLEFSSTRRELTVNQEIPSDTLLLRIQRKNLISLGNSIAQSPCIQQVKDSLLLQEDHHHHHHLLHFPVIDVLVAFFSLASSSTTSTYLKTLPNHSAWDALPRRWSDEQIDNYLKGSPLHERIKKDRLGSRSDYDCIVDKLSSLKNDNNNNILMTNNMEHKIPSFELFDDMLGAVTSRAFADPMDGIVMIPILDLCNHSRGKGEMKKNLKYKTLLDDDDGGGGGGSIEVKTTQIIQQYEALRLTYGARSNGQLLSNYGFAIPASVNIEPDGSCNDFLEFNCNGRRGEAAVITLRTGPKAYTYGSFVKLLEQCMDENDKTCSNSPGGDDAADDDMEAFLNGCDDSQDNIDIYNQIPNNDEDDGDEGCDDNNENEELEEEKKSLQQLREVILQRMEEYECKGSKMKERMDLPPNSPGRYSALLIQSEQRCLYFYYRAAQKVELKLQDQQQQKEADHHSISKPQLFCNLMLDKNDLDLIEEQTTELANAYMTIRHSENLLF